MQGIDGPIPPNMLALMTKLAAAGDSLWNGYRPDVSNYVFVVPGAEKKSCAVLWRKRLALSNFETVSPPRLQTSLFGCFGPAPADQKNADRLSGVLLAGLEKGNVLGVARRRTRRLGDPLEM